MKFNVVATRGFGRVADTLPFVCAPQRWGRGWRVVATRSFGLYGKRSIASKELSCR